jgi:A/G-specific adenine glycosylase
MAKRDSEKNGELAPLTPRQVAAFRKMIREWYRTNGRPLPWRETRDPYAILVSEIMLQQTQVDRVRTKYTNFLSLFPDIATLARAPLDAVLAAWQGLGYNRRAVSLKRCAEVVAERWGGTLPATVEELESLPGIGPYTARAIATFAFGQPTVFIETNIRTVFIHSFFNDRQGIHDRELLPLVTCTLDRRDPRDWYYALMDYGVMLKKSHANPGRRSTHHVRQSPFEGSNRELRSRILRALLAAPGITEAELIAALGADPANVRNNLARMETEGFLSSQNGRLTIG